MRELLPVELYRMRMRLSQQRVYCIARSSWLKATRASLRAFWGSRALTLGACFLLLASRLCKALLTFSPQPLRMQRTCRRRLRLRFRA